MIELIVFDFDGTLADTKKMYYGAIHSVLKNEGVKFAEKKFNEVFGLRLADIMKHLGVEKEKINAIDSKIRESVMLHKIEVAHDIELIKNIPIKKIIVSNTITKNINETIAQDSVKFFDEVYGGDRFEDKVQFIKEYAEKKGLKGDEVVYIGDMARDVAIARKSGCFSIVISHRMSWDSRSKLLEAGPDFIISGFKELRGILDKLNKTN